MTYGPYKTYPARQTYLVTFVLGVTGWSSERDYNLPIFNVDVADSRTGAGSGHLQGCWRYSLDVAWAAPCGVTDISCL
jgi:hypothetical protein